MQIRESGTSWRACNPPKNLPGPLIFQACLANRYSCTATALNFIEWGDAAATCH